MFHHPAAEGINFRSRIVFAGDQQRRDLQPDRSLVLQVEEGFKYRLELSGAEILVEALGEALQIDVSRIHVAEQLAPRVGADVACAYRYGFDPARTAGLRDVDRVLQKDHGIVVGEGYRAAAIFDRSLRDRLRRGAILQPIESARFRYVPVLAELAREIAAGSAEREDRRPGQEMVERLFLDRIDAETGGAAIGREHDRFVRASAHEAQSALAFVEPAIARADVALNAPGCLEPWRRPSKSISEDYEP